MPRQTEPNANNALGDLLRSMLPGCQVRSENTQTFPNHPGRHADVLITAPGPFPGGRRSGVRTGPTKRKGTLPTGWVSPSKANREPLR